ncbi:hypothetical protein [Bacillus sp. AFS017336]|uniref:hypothetical protein n=1 Tax=Bacillus sp. AFS017336 TaxID=2033489 RepID=UPI000BF1E052|nr:hypothetical protein [Bacillus sp. AFS017336]PEK98185.1 hypothetical protein CN601_26100 [Bacillus sp. AFS017336]
MSLLNRYGKWLFKDTVRKYDLAELLSYVIFIPLVIYGTKYLHNFSIWISILMGFMALNLFQLGDDLLRRILGNINMKIPKWISNIPIVCIFFYIIIK